MAECHYSAAMMPDRGTEVRRTKDGRAWRVGLDTEFAWIRENTINEPGLGITACCCRLQNRLLFIAIRGPFGIV